ncbi:hypothetical protein B0T24DRAFT_20325 [Lasiosphaeria ovina]|uniref:Uncharacterized protein n=1 Tax=Lasiosphaeria ovina TaxID=92902 RepID=A0AAE0NJP8_9PEZI|nr:hypothetical protein B0T24DRAFT_20325 [Lasiosphaeria ovina]
MVLDDKTTYACDVSTPLPVTAATAKWTSPTLPTGSAQLVPRPSPPYVAKSMDPAPQKDCTDMSLAHPDWTVNDAVYVPGSASGIDVTESTSLNLTLTSRALSLGFQCRFTGNATGTGDATVLQLSCSRDSSTPDPYGSQSVFAIEYKPSDKSLKIRHDWLCGDPAGKYIADYRASKTVTIPFTCAGDAGGVCRTTKVVVRGELLRSLKLTPSFFPAPPNADTKGCTANSAAPAWVISRFLYTEISSILIFNGAQLGGTADVAKTLEVELRNTANNFTESCRLGSEGGRCLNGNYPAEGQRSIETHVRFNLAESNVSVNQTWYCNDTETSGL